MRAIIFDFDGVIVDSEPAHEASLRAALEAIDIALSHEEFLSRCLGKGDRNCLIAVARAHGRELDGPDLDALIARKNEVFLDRVERGLIRPYEGTLALIRAAAERCPVGVCSGSSRRSVEPVLRRLDLLGMLGAIVVAEDVTRTKPDPEAYRLAAMRLAVGPERCVAIEDTPTGIRAAVAAGMRVAAVGHTLPAERLSEAHAVYRSTDDLTVPHLLDL